MRAPIFLPLLLCVSLGAQGQKFVNPFTENTFQGCFGLAAGTVNYRCSTAGGFNMGVMFNFLETKNSSLCFGTSVKAGFENENGLGLPTTAADVLLVLFGQNTLGPSSYYAGYYEFPLLLRYNFGNGATLGTKKRMGFYIGGGVEFMGTGYQGSSGNAESISFFGATAEAGFRIGNIMDVGIFKVFSFRQPLGPITNNPGFFGITLGAYITRKGLK